MTEIIAKIKNLRVFTTKNNNRKVKLFKRTEVADGRTSYYCVSNMEGCCISRMKSCRVYAHIGCSTDEEAILEAEKLVPVFDNDIIFK